MINNKGYDGAKADLWSCGVILFVLMAGFLPFEESNLMALYKKVTFFRTCHTHICIYIICTTLLRFKIINFGQLGSIRLYLYVYQHDT